MKKRPVVYKTAMSEYELGMASRGQEMDTHNQDVGWPAKPEGNLTGAMSVLPMMSAVVSPRDAGDSEGFTVTVLWERRTWSLWAFSSLASLMHTCENGSS